MDPQSLFNAMFGIAAAAGGWFAKTLYIATQELRRDVNDLHIELARDYVPVKRFEEATERLADKLDIIISQLDRKADRP